MGQSVDLHIYELDKLKISLGEIGASGELLDKILAKCGLISENNYILLNNEIWDDGNPYYSLSDLIDAAFKIEGSFKILLYTEHQREGINHIEIDEVSEELKIDI